MTEPQAAADSMNTGTRGAACNDLLEGSCYHTTSYIFHICGCVHMPQMVLANIAMLAENGQVLLDSKLPEEFLVAVPMRLSEVGGMPVWGEGQ